MNPLDPRDPNEDAAEALGVAAAVLFVLTIVWMLCNPGVPDGAKIMLSFVMIIAAGVGMRVGGEAFLRWWDRHR